MKRKNKIFAFFMTLVLALTIATPAFADEKDKEVDLDCDTLNMSCHIQEFFLNMAKDSINDSLDRIEMFVVKPNEVLKDPVISNLFEKSQEFFFPLITVIFIYKLVELLASTDIENHKGLKDKIIQLVFASALAYSFPTIFKWLLTFNNWIVADVLHAGVAFDKFKFSQDKIEETGFSMMMSGLLSLILGILFFIMLFQLAIRYAEMAFAVCIAPIVIATALTDNFNMLPGFWRNLLSVIFTQAIQILLISLMANMFIDTSVWERNGILYALGFMFLIVKTPHMLKEYMYSSGSGKTTVNMGAGAFSTMAKEVFRRKM